MGNIESIGLVMGLLFWIAIISIIIIPLRARKKRKKLEELNKVKMKKQGQLAKSTFSLMTGLPLAEKTLCDLTYYNDKIEIQGGGQIFNIALNKITDMVITTDVEINKQYVSSIGGAVTGAIAFGPLGAIVGGRAKEKKSTQIFKYMVITYINNKNETDYISFDVTNNFKANDFISHFNKKENKDVKITEL